MEFKGDITGLNELEKRIEQYYIDRLIQAGEAAVQKAVVDGNYQNITGDLRSSIGYVIAYNGKIIKEGGFYKIQGRGNNMQKVEFTTKDGKQVSFWAKGNSVMVPMVLRKVWSSQGRKLVHLGILSFWLLGWNMQIMCQARGSMSLIQEF